MKHILLLISLTMLSVSFFGQGNATCAQAAPFCSGSLSQYPSSVGQAPVPPGQNIGCLGSAPNPAWFTIPVSSSGQLTVNIFATSDVDFICWGPFPSASGNCNNLNPTTQVPNTGGNHGCSYSGSPTETLVIANAQAGEFYVLLVTNFSGLPQQINVVQGGGSGSYGTFEVVGTPSVCAGKTATMQVLPGANIQSVQWFTPAGMVGTNYFQSFPNLNATTTFTVVGHSAASQTCSVSRTVLVVQNPVPLVVNNGPICVGESATLTASGATTYQWQGPANFSSPNSTVAATSVSGAQLSNTGTYTVLATLQTCTAIATNYLLVKPNPTVTVAQTGNFCFGKSFGLLSGGATTYTWTGPNSFGYQGQNPLFINNNFPMSGLYYVTGEVNGCKSTTSTSVTVYPLPNVTAVSSGTVCQSASFSINGGGATHYVWSGPGSFHSNLDTLLFASGQPNMTGLYNVTGTDIHGCVNTATVYQTVRPTPFVNIYSSNACINKSLSLSADGGTSYKWEGPGNYTSVSQYPVITNVTEANGGVYTVTVTSLYGCPKTATIENIVYRNPDVRYSGEVAICKGKTFSFSAAGAINYKWLNSTGIITESPTFTISSVSPDLQATYTLVGTDGHFCSNNAMIYPIVQQLPVARIALEKERACTPFCSEINLDLLSKNITIAKWTYSDGDKSPGNSDATIAMSKCFNSPGIYTINVSLGDANNCKNVVTTTLEALPSPRADFKFTPEKPTENDNVVTFIDNTSGSDVQKYTWNFYFDDKGTKRDTSYLPGPTRTYLKTGNYVVFMKVSSANGCADSLAKILVVSEDPTFFVPSAFTPNGDGLNDFFMPKAIGVSKYNMEVFTRWGQLLFHSNDPAVGWNGKSAGGDALPNGTYIYKFVLSGPDREPATYTGQFSLMK